MLDYLYADNDYCNIFVDRKATAGASAYGGSPPVLPAKIEAVNFDLGGEGIGYHKVTFNKEGGSVYRSDVSVDIYSIGAGTFVIDSTVCSEWLGYTVDVPQNGYYNIIVRGSTAFTGATFHLEKDFVFLTPESEFPNTGSWNNFQNDTLKNIYLVKGNYQVKFVWDNEAISLEYLQFDASVNTGIRKDINDQIVAYPNPFTNSIHISVANDNLKAVRLYDVTSRLVYEGFTNQVDNLDALLPGIYLLEIETNIGNATIRLEKISF
jgi:hypothetical protein